MALGIGDGAIRAQPVFAAPCRAVEFAALPDNNREDFGARDWFAGGVGRLERDGLRSVEHEPRDRHVMPFENPAELVQPFPQGVSDPDRHENRVSALGKNQRIRYVYQWRGVDDDHVGLFAQLREHRLDATELEQIDPVHTLGSREEEL